MQPRAQREVQRGAAERALEALPPRCRGVGRAAQGGQRCACKREGRGAAGFVDGARQRGDAAGSRIDDRHCRRMTELRGKRASAKQPQAQLQPQA